MKEYFNTETACYFETPPYSRILSLIGDGKENAIHKSDLLRLVDMSDRELRKTIEFLRRKGIIILPGDSGYYFPANMNELKRYIKQEESRAESILYTLNSAKKLL